MLKQVPRTPDGKKVSASTVYVAQGKMRMERIPIDEHAPMPHTAMVTHEDSSKGWILFLDTKRYLEVPTDDPKLNKLRQRMPQGRKVESLGKESILGQDYEKKKASNTIGLGPRTLDVESTVWECEGFEQPFKVVGKRGEMTESVSLTPGPQPDELLEMPPGFEKAANMILETAVDRPEAHASISFQAGSMAPGNSPAW